MKRTNVYLKVRQGFTIVELLIVIVVIAILAAIAVISFRGVQNRAHDSIVQSDLIQFAKMQAAAVVTGDVPSWEQYHNRMLAGEFGGDYEVAWQQYGAAIENFLNKFTYDSYSASEEYTLVAVYTNGYSVETGGYPTMSWVNSPGFDIAGISRSGKVFIITRALGGVVRNIDGWDDFISNYELRAESLESELAYVRENHPGETSWIEWLESEQVVATEQIRSGNERRASGGDVWYVQRGGCSTTSVIGQGEPLYAYNRQQGRWILDPYPQSC